MKSLMIAAAAAVALMVGSLATPSTAEARGCYRGGYGGYGGYGYNAGFRGYGPTYGGYYGPARATTFYRGGYGYGYGPRYYGPRSGFSLRIGF